MQAAEMLKDLPCRDSNHFSKYSQGVYKLSEVKKYVKLKQDGDTATAQAIEMDQQSLLRRDMEAASAAHTSRSSIAGPDQSLDQSRQVLTKRQSQNTEGHCNKLRRTESESDDQSPPSTTEQSNVYNY